ncbi:hypothetical protein RJ639_011553, partial [Escallonia herrerae]
IKTKKLAVDNYQEDVPDTYQEDSTPVVVPIPVDDDDMDDIPLQAVGMPDEVMGEEEDEDEDDAGDNEEEDDDEEVDLCNVPRPLEVVVVLYLLSSVEVTVEGYFDFESLEQEAVGRVAFFHHISTNYTKWMEGARRFAISKVGEDEHIELWRNHPPEWIRNDIWQKMVDVWESTKWQEKSRCAKTNRSVNDEPSHTGGSVPYAVIGVELKEKMPDISDAKLNLEVYELTHKLKHDSNGQPSEQQDRPYVSKKAKAIRDACAVRFDEISSQEPSSSLIDYDAVELWRQTPGVPDKKGRIRGTREIARDARASMHISLDQPPSSKNWKDEIAKIVQLEVQKMKETEIAKLVEIEVEKWMKEKDMQQDEVSATDATEDGNDETFDELGG